jgi:hypothetical protein
VRTLSLLVIGLTTVLVSSSSPVLALSQGNHEKVTNEACLAAGLPFDYCRRAGLAASNVDGSEWDDMAAHAQRDVGQPACEAADLAAQRLQQLGSSVVAAQSGAAFDIAADEVGRALHTLQDECAHHGMNNQQHAHFSLLDTCGQTGQSPDSKPEAMACAVAQSRAAFELIASHTRKNQILLHCDFDQSCNNRVGPSPLQACAFLRSHKLWDGFDTQWTPAVGAKLLAAFRAGLDGQPFGAICADGEITPAQPAKVGLDIAQSCTLTSIGCLGKVDGEEELDSSGGAGAGCTASHGADSGWLLVVVALLPLARRRRL